MHAILRTKITPPRPTRRTLERPRVTAALSEAFYYRLTRLQAGAGYGKSTALATLAVENPKCIWYQVSNEDADPLVFLLHLCHAAQRAHPHLSQLPTASLEGWDITRGPLPTTQIIYQFLNAFSSETEAVLLILDDIHRVIEGEEFARMLDALIGGTPSHVHILLSSRSPIKLPHLNHWIARGDVLTLDKETLAFTPEEIDVMFHQQYGYELTQDEVEILTTLTDGWAISLQLIWQGLRSGSIVSVGDLLPPMRGDTGKQQLAFHEDFRSGFPTLQSLFEVLAEEVLDQQPADVREFLLTSAVLRVMQSDPLDTLRSASDSAQMLAYLQKQELFVIAQEDGSLRYQHIFHRFLRQRLPAPSRQALHRKAAEHFTRVEAFDEAIYHHFKAADENHAAEILVMHGRALLASGRTDTLKGYLDALPPESFHAHPDLLIYQGEIARLHNRFQDALGWYQQAEHMWNELRQTDGVGRALRGQARVYLDTVNPKKAEELLQKALQISDGSFDRETHARLYELLAENKLNAGHGTEAEELRKKATALRKEGYDESQLLYRVLLRTGRIQEAQDKLETRAKAEENSPVQTPRAHRETHLLLSLIYAFQGQAEAASLAADTGLQRGESLDAPFVIAVGHMRQGHAFMLSDEPDRYVLARQQFERAIEISQSLATPRLRVEANWGLCRVFGYQGDLVKAQETAVHAIELANQFGDEWVASLVRLTMGCGYALKRRYEVADQWLEEASRGFAECADQFGETAARLWRCLGWYRTGNTARLEQMMSEVLTTCRENHYDFIFLRPTLLGPPDERMFTPLLVWARKQAWDAPYAGELLHALGLENTMLHPGYQLRVQALGGFLCWRGQTVIPTKGWRREKTRQLFQLLLTYRHTALERDQIYEHLWPGLEPEAAKRNFKVALNTLYQVLEPDRERGSDSAYVQRDGSFYQLREGVDLDFDVSAFESACAAGGIAQKRGDTTGRMQALREAVQLYAGEYLPDARYETWAAAERERLSVRFLRAADQLAELYIAENQLSSAIELCRRILAEDNCWERAYRYLMRVYHEFGDQGQVARTYQKCVRTLREELDVSPAEETVILYNQLTHQPI